MDFDFDDDYFEDNLEDELDEFDSFELEEDPLSDTIHENDEELEKDYFDIEDAMFWGGFVWTMAEEEREERTRTKKSKDPGFNKGDKA